jgi:hypothetical protein
MKRASLIAVFALLASPAMALAQFPFASPGPLTAPPAPTLDGGPSGLAVSNIQSLQMKVGTVSTLPRCSAALAGTVYMVSDAAGPGYNVPVSANGWQTVFVVCDGSMWKTP